MQNREAWCAGLDAATGHSPRWVANTRPKTIAWYERRYGYRKVGTLGKLCSFGDPDVESTLLEMIHRDDHDRMTYQECAKQLAKLGSQQAVRRIEELQKALEGMGRDDQGYSDKLQELLALQQQKQRLRSRE